MSHHHDFNIVYSENENSDAKNFFPTNCESFHNCNTCQSNDNMFTISCIPMPKCSCPVWETLHSHMFSHVWHTCFAFTVSVNLCCQKHQSVVSQSLWRQDLKTFSRPLMTGSDRIYNKSHIYPSSVLQLSSDMAIYTVIHLFFHSCQTHSGSHRLDSFSIPAVSLAHRELWELLSSYCSTPWARANKSLGGPDFPIRHTCEDKQLYSPDSSCPFNPIWVHLPQPRPYLLHTSALTASCGAGEYRAAEKFKYPWVLWQCSQSVSTCRSVPLYCHTNVQPAAAQKKLVQRSPSLHCHSDDVSSFSENLIL